MRMLMTVLLMIIGFGCHFASATMRSLTPQEQAATCYPSSPMLYSDACWGVPYTGGNFYRIQANDPFSEMYTLMNALQGRGAMNMNPLTGLSLDPTMLWQRSSMMGNSPILSAVPIVK